MIQSATAEFSATAVDSFKEAYDEWNQISVIPIIDLSQDESSVKIVNAGVEERDVLTIDSEEGDVDNNNSRCNVPSLLLDTVKPVCWDEVETYFVKIDLSRYAELICPVRRYSKLQRFISMITFSQTSLRKSLEPERNRVFSLALVPFDNCDPWHYRFLITIYQQLTHCNPNDPVPRLGSHWETIGFQGIDPATDLRGVGIFAIYQLLYLTLSPDHSLLCHDIYSLSLDPVQQFPFAAMSTNITAIVLQVLRSGKLNRHLNKKFNVIKVMHNLYCDLYYQLIKIWSRQSKTIKDAGFVLKEIKSKCSKHLRSIIGSSNNYGSQENERFGSIKEDFVEFSNIGDVFDSNTNTNDANNS